MAKTILKSAAVALLLTSTSIANAETAQSGAAGQQSFPVESEFEKFQPKPSNSPTRIDFSIWDDALSYFVFPMGYSIREGAPTVDAELGTRRVYGHESRYRLEGNRVIFSYLDDDIKASLTEYRKDLESTLDRVDITKLGRNEQLAFWMNLHNVAVIEQIALDYPVSQPSRIKVNGSDLPLDETPFITVSGVNMSPKDIRTKIVYPNWDNPKVIYGFFRGEIGGPSILRNAFTGANVGDLLDESAAEFVNSLRGTQKNGSKLDVSKIYDEARPFFFQNWETDIRDHLLTYSNAEVTSLIERTSEVRARLYETDVSDLANGERDPNYNFVVSGENVKGLGLPSSIQRLLREHSQKLQKIEKDKDLQGRVKIINVGDLTKPKEPDEVE